MQGQGINIYRNLIFQWDYLVYFSQKLFLFTGQLKKTSECLSALYLWSYKSQKIFVCLEYRTAEEQCTLADDMCKIVWYLKQFVERNKSYNTKNLIIYDFEGQKI